MKTIIFILMLSNISFAITNYVPRVRTNLIFSDKIICQNVTGQDCFGFDPNVLDLEVLVIVDEKLVEDAALKAAKVARLASQAATLAASLAADNDRKAQLIQAVRDWDTLTAAQKQALLKVLLQHLLRREIEGL